MLVFWGVFYWTQRFAQFECGAPFEPSLEREAQIDIAPILSQPFRYLAKGTQSVVFASEDGLYVVKIFRFDRKGGNAKSLFAASLLAYDLLKEETGLIYLHLNETEGKLPLLGGVRLPLDRCRFVVQKRGKSFEEVLLKAKDDPMEMERRLEQFFVLLKSRTGKGISNKDPNLRRNFGFLEDRAIELDFGNYEKRPSLDARSEISRYARRLERWLKKKVPEGLFYLESQLAEIEKGACPLPGEKTIGAPDRM